MLNRLQHKRGGNRVVDDQGHSGSVRHTSHCFKVHDVASGISDGLAEDGACSIVDQRPDGCGLIVNGEPRFDTQGRKHMGEIRKGGTVELWRDDEVRTGECHSEDGVADSGHPGRDDKRSRATLKRGNALLQDIVRGIVDPVVVKSRYFEIQDRARVFGVDEIVRNGLINGNGDCSCAIGLITAVNGDRLIVHRICHSSW